MRLYTFYTKDTPYEEEAHKSVEAFAKFGINLISVPYINQRDWMKNALLRSRLLSDYAHVYPNESIGMVDCDNRPKRSPEKIINFNADFGCHFRGPDVPTHMRYSAGITMFGATDAGRRVLKNWYLKCGLDEDVSIPLREQHYLCEVVEAARANPEFKFTDFGEAYNRKPEDVRPGDDTVMIHYVASRRLLKVIGGKR